MAKYWNEMSEKEKGDWMEVYQLEQEIKSKLDIRYTLFALKITEKEFWDKIHKNHHKLKDIRLTE